MGSTLSAEVLELIDNRLEYQVSVVQYSAVQYSTVQCSTVRYRSVQPALILPSVITREMTNSTNLSVSRHTLHNDIRLSLKWELPTE